MEQQIDDSVVFDRMVAVLSAFFGLLATLLAAVGLYGVMAYTVARRTREIGIRVALGADRARVLRMVMGEVVPGDQRGRTIGFPTANIILDPGAEPFRGIYAVTARDTAAPASTPYWQGAAYFGDRPTFDTKRTFLEVHLLDQDIDLYGKILMVNFVDLIRPDKTFKGVADLVTQMHADCAEVRKVLASDVAENFPLRKMQAAAKI